MLLYAFIIFVLMFWSFTLAVRVLLIGRTVSNLEKKLATLTSVDPFKTALDEQKGQIAAATPTS